MAVFENNAWNRTMPDLVVFDDVFVDGNVHSGLAVYPHHRQNLHELILGAQAVALSRRIQGLFEETEKHNRELRTKEAAIPAADRGPFSVDDVCALPFRADVEQAILEAERALAAAREQDAIRTTPLFATLDLPTFDLDAMGEVLRRDLPSLDAATLGRLQEHFATLGDGGEAWVSDGMLRVQVREPGDICPLCAQSIRRSPLIEHYRAYFSDAYTDLKRSVSETAGRVGRAHDGNAKAEFERAVRVAVQRRQFWARFCEVPDLSLDTAAVVRDWSAAGEAVVAQLNAKQAAPLERMQVLEDTRTRVEAYLRHRETIAEVNRRLRDSNASIGVAKVRAAVADSAVLAAEVARLKAVRARYDPGTAALCDAYLAELAAKEETDRQREQARTELEHHRTRVFPGYEAAINNYLVRFNAGFRLNSLAYANTRGGPTCTYNVLINNERVPVRGAEDVPGKPTFRNTLSAGDRNTLALALFFASLDQTPNLASKVVVIDDPISSLDDHRATATVQEVRYLAARAAQVIVLSHNKSFLCGLWEGTDATQRAALEVVREAVGSTLRSWDVSHDTVTEHDRRHARLRAHISGQPGNLRDVAQSIRLHLEAFLRVACPGEFPPGTRLGRFVTICRQRLGTPQEIVDRAAVEELGALVDYAQKFHHETNPASETEEINDGELSGFVKRTLHFARR